MPVSPMLMLAAGLLQYSLSSSRRPLMPSSLAVRNTSVVEETESLGLHVLGDLRRVSKPFFFPIFFFFFSWSYSPFLIPAPCSLFAFSSPSFMPTAKRCDDLDGHN